MNRGLESELRAAFTERAGDVGVQAAERMRRIDYKPRAYSLGPRAALGAGAGLAATGGAIVAVVGLAASASPAFAGWTSTPTAPANGETVGALAACTAQLAGAGGGQSGVPTTGWQAVLTDTRGPFTAMILRDGGASATCFSGPSFTTVSADSSQGAAGSQHVLSGSQNVLSVGSGSGAGQSTTSVMGRGDSNVGPISQASQAHLATGGGQPYTFVQGQLDAGVTAVTLVRSDGSSVQATVSDGSFVAWWPSSADASSAQVASASGMTTQQLTFTALPSNPANTNRSTSASASKP
jgi:hypothetical protein